ncbi:MAG TPA: 6-phosphogluconolactonase [Candidatus Wallbacteria bacterium]|nr:6-phosphogluconolactonase [Candidatus Wallbacteria bacterium]
MLKIEYSESMDVLCDKFSNAVLGVICAKQSLGLKTAVGLCGGKTPECFYSSLAAASNSDKASKIDWNRVYFFMGDERAVPLDSEESNYKNAVKNLCGESKIPVSRIAPLDFGHSSPGESAADYESKIFTKAPGGKFDLLILGIGGDGHTASLFERTIHGCAGTFISHYVPKLSAVRYTLTPSAIYGSENIFALVTGKEKKGVLIGAMNEESGADEIPASMIFKKIKNRSVILFTDIKLDKTQ